MWTNISNIYSGSINIFILWAGSGRKQRSHSKAYTWILFWRITTYISVCLDAKCGPIEENSQSKSFTVKWQEYLFNTNLCKKHLSVLNNFFIPQSHIFCDSRCVWAFFLGGVSKIISELVKVIKYVEDALSNVPQLFMGGPGLGRMRARSLCSIDILHGSLWRVTRDMWCRHDLWLALTLPAVITRLSLRSDDDKLSSESAKQREDFHSDYFCQTDGSHPDFPHTGRDIVSDHQHHQMSRVVTTLLMSTVHTAPVSELSKAANVRRAFVIATRAKYPRNENTSQPLSLYDWPIRELGAAKRNHISDVIRISSELIRTWRQQLMQHLIMTWYPDPDSGVTRVSTHQYWRPRHIWSHWSGGRRPGRGWTGGGSPAWVPRAPPPSSDLGDISLANLKWKGKLMMGFVCLGVRAR